MNLSDFSFAGPIDDNAADEEIILHQYSRYLVFTVPATGKSGRVWTSQEKEKMEDIYDKV